MQNFVEPISRDWSIIKETSTGCIYNDSVLIPTAIIDANYRLDFKKNVSLCDIALIKTKWRKKNWSMMLLRHACENSACCCKNSQAYNANTTGGVCQGHVCISRKQMRVRRSPACWELSTQRTRQETARRQFYIQRATMVRIVGVSILPGRLEFHFRIDRTSFPFSPEPHQAVKTHLFLRVYSRWTFHSLTVTRSTLETLHVYTYYLRINLVSTALLLLLDCHIPRDFWGFCV